MALILCHSLHCSLTAPAASLPSIKSSRPKISAISSMEQHNDGSRKFIEFPFVSAPHKDLMVGLVSTVENRLGSQLHTCTLPLDVQHYQNPSGSAQASLYIRSGIEPSLVDFILGSWIHCDLPTGGALNITSLSAYLSASTDAPNFLFELIRSSPTSVVLIVDLPPRKDLVLYPDYLQTFYENTQLESRRQSLAKLPEVQPYFSSSLYIRCLSSPTAIMVRIETKAGQPERMEEIIKDHVDPIAKEVLGIWLDQCACGKREVGETEKACLEKRDKLIKSQTVEIDIGSSFPRLFGPEVAERVVGVIREFYGV
ncbi:red chlorophyll catabolite reductase, chloroplastic-like [Tripterygium wilfordii]|nr:red chlorophyll catabolite reductase, chloroplastic-like [Tripterygium wilfordii]